MYNTAGIVHVSGIDAFDNIQRQLDAVMGVKPSEPVPAKAEEAEASVETNGVAEDSNDVGSAAAAAAVVAPKSILKST